MGVLNYTTLSKDLISHYIRKIQCHAHHLDEPSKPDHLHQVRTHLRRLRNSLKVFKDLFEESERKAWDEDLKALSKVTSPARDEDIQIAFLKKYKKRLHGHKDSRAIDSLIFELECKRDQRQPQILACLRQVQMRQIFNQILIYLNHHQQINRYPVNYIYHVGFRWISRCIQKVLSYERYVSQPKAKNELHQMRIANKYLRYTIEGLKDVYSIEIVCYLKTITFIHKTLGAVHDNDVWVDLLNKRLNQDMPLKTSEIKAFNDLKNFCQSRRNDCYNDFHKTWVNMKNQAFFEDLSGYLRSAAET